ncbi:MAG: peptidase domain-containing ABC transporter [Gammaproteobacteria bacterium]|nr:peptidase domain-containing ABC transporter [Gammaproteobacteria bacterium]
MIKSLACLRFRSRPQLPMILQDEMAECGHACIAMIAGFWGHALDLSTLRHLNQPSIRGITLRQIHQILEQLKFKTRALRVSLDDIALIKTPAILHWNTNHFVVLKQIKKNKITVHDPAFGTRVCHLEEFALAFSGIALEVEPTDAFATVRGHSKFTLWHLCKMTSGITRALSLSLVLSVIIECLQMIHPIFMQYVMDDVVGSNALHQMYLLGMACVLLVLLQGLAQFLREHLVLFTTIQTTESLASALFKHLLSLPLRFFTHRHVSDIQTKFQSIETIKHKLGTDLLHTALDGVMIIIAITVMLAYSPTLGLIVFMTSMIYGFALYTQFRSFKTHASTAVALHAKCTLTFVETLQAISSVKAFLQESLRFQLWRHDHTDALNHDILGAKLQIRHRVFNQALFHVEHVGVVCVGAHLVLSQQLSVGMLLAFLAYRMMLVTKFSALIQSLFSYQLCAVQLERLHDLSIQEPETNSTPHRTLTKGAMNIQSLSFHYHPHDKVILNNINFTIQAGEKIALIGPSGCGKTTLIKVMMGLEQPSSGDIMIDDTPMRLFGIENFRRFSASVLQNDTLFTGSILDNITFFAEDLDMEKVYRVAKLAHIHDTILNFPMGYESLINQMSATISGGQKQRILLARALYKDPKFLFLDEATSHLDKKTEQAINESLKKLNMTQIIVAHRQETIAMADRVIDFGAM